MIAFQTAGAEVVILGFALQFMMYTLHLGCIESEMCPLGHSILELPGSKRCLTDSEIPGNA